MGHDFSEKDKRIFFKLVPEVNMSTMSENGHNYPFILRPLSHKFSKDTEDFKQRISKLTKEELDYIVDLILCNKEELGSLEEDDIKSFLDVVSNRLSVTREIQLKNHIGLFI